MLLPVVNALALAAFVAYLWHSRFSVSGDATLPICLFFLQLTWILESSGYLSTGANEDSFAGLLTLQVWALTSAILRELSLLDSSRRTL